MPTRHQAFLEQDREMEVFTEMVNLVRKEPDYFAVSQDKRYIMMAFDICDKYSGQPVMREIVTLYANQEKNALEIQDMDLVLTDSPVCELTELHRLDKSTEFWEAYTAAVNERHLELETVNRQVIPDHELTEPVQAAVSVFPFQYMIFPDAEALSDYFGYVTMGDTIPELAGHKVGIGTDFTAGSFLVKKDPDDDESFSVISAVIEDYAKTTLVIGSKECDAYVLGCTIANIKGMKVILPADKETEEKLKNGTCIYMHADVKADLAVGQYDYCKKA